MATTIRTNCPRDCYDGCGILVEVRDVGPHRVLGDPDHPVSRGRLCSKCAVAYNGVWQDPAARVLHPLRRNGPKGSGEFTRIGWPDALSLVAERTHETIARHGAQAVLHTHYSGTLGLIGYTFPSRFFHRIGATEVDPDTICNAAGHVAWTLLFGTSIRGFDPRAVRDARCIFVWGANPSHSAPHAHEHWLREHDARVVVIDPVRTESAIGADLHLRPRPGTDAALAFSLLHCLARDGRLDRAFIAAHTLGYEEIADDIVRASPAWGEARTGVPAEDIERAAAWYGEGPSLLWCGQALQRQTQGGNVMRAVGLLPALTGNVGKPGAGFYYLNVTPLFAGIDLGWLAGADLARPEARKISHMAFAERLTSEEFRTLFVWNTNPLASAPAQQRLRAAFSREDLFTVVVDPFMTDTARHADVVLPAATFLECDDVTFSYFHLHIGAQVRVAAPLGEALPNAEIFRRLARAMGLTDPALHASDRDLLAQITAQMNMGIDFATLAERGHVTLGDSPQLFFDDLRFDTPSGRIEIASARAEAMGLPRIPRPDVDAPAPPGHYRLLTPASKLRLNDAYANDPHLARLSGAASVHVHPGDAVHAGIADGATVRLTNGEGSLVLVARLDDAVLPGTLLAYKGRWPSLEPGGGNVNVLHAARAADMGESTSVHATLVRMAPA
jgi:anaerobic selenocysteine-containing dehydrogenase